MPSHISHIYYAQRYGQQYRIGNKDGLRSFIVGTLFPDIKHQIGTEKHSTHPKFWSTQVKIQNPFDLGMYTHILVDERWEEEVIKNDLLSEAQKNPGFALGLKALEDSLLYDFINKDEVIEYLDSIVDQELRFTEVTEVRRWHDTLVNYFSSPLSNKQLINLYRASGVSKDFIGKVLQAYNYLGDNNQYINALKNFTAKMSKDQTVPNEVVSVYERTGSR